jgi:hypothetical protein
VPKALDDLIRKVMASPSVPSKSAAIAILKANGTIQQDGSSLAFTAKGRKSAIKRRKKK